jgi:hypothetical protein
MWPLKQNCTQGLQEGRTDDYDGMFIRNVVYSLTTLIVFLYLGSALKYIIASTDYSSVIR